jgi:hypothetical protein
MRRTYDIFEKLPNGSALWRGCVSGRYEAQRKVQELAELSENQFYTMQIEGEELLSSNEKGDSRPAAKAAANG